MLPTGAKFLRTNWQQSNLMIWFEVNIDAPQLEKKFFLYGTGNDIAIDHQYVTTFDNGPFVMHLYELKRV